MKGARAVILVALVVVTTFNSSSVAAEEAGGLQSAGETLATQDGNGTGQIRLQLNFQEAPLQTVLEYLSEKANLTVIADAALDGRLTVISRQPITLDEAVGLINSVLNEKDLAAVRVGKTLKVVTLQQAKQMNIPVTEGWDPNALPDGDVMLTHVLPLRYVTAAALKQNLQALLPAYATLEANEDGNALIITDTAAHIKRLMQIVRALDAHLASVAEIRVFRLVNADATSAATLINSIFQQDAQSGGGGRQGGRGNIMETVMQRGGPGGPFGDVGGGVSDGPNSGAGSGRVRVVAAADSRTNSVVVRGPAETLVVVAGMIEALDNRTAVIADVRVFQLRYADALNAAQLINQLFGQESSSSRNQQNAGPAAFFMRGDPTMQTTSQDETGSTLKVVAAADSRTNTVVVTGPEAVLKVVAAMIERLDAQVPNVADVKVFHLEYADAPNTASLINEVFGASRTSSSSRTGNQPNQQIQFGMRGGFGQQQTAQDNGASSSDVAVVASADSRTNSIVVSGPPETLALIAQVVTDLDENPEQERQIFVYALKNGTADNLMTILNNLFTEMQALNQQGTSSRTGQQFRGAAASAASGAQSTSSGANDLSEETYFEADEETNSLLVMTSTKNYEKIKPIVDELDKPVGQVLIKVLFAEITHSDNVDLGTEFSAWNLRGAGPDRNVEFSTNFPPDLSSGITASVLDNTLDATIRALQQTAKLNILSRPYILTSNNQTATITVANEVPFATGSTTSDAGQTVITTDYRSIGIILSVTPQINPEGLVILTVSPEISSTTSDTVRVSQDLSLPIFATRTSETKVAVQNGQTIVIGGLIQDEIRDSVSKVPLLGDVPVVGGLFRRKQKDKAKTELLIFLTPHVAVDASALDPISNHERARSNLRKDPGIADTFRDHIIGLGGLHNTDAAEPNEP